MTSLGSDLFNKGKIIVFILLASLFFVVTSLNAQVLDSILTTYSSRYGHERIYLHYDKSAYSPGETVWFKAYLLEGTLPASGSKTLYVDWADEKGTLLFHTSAPIVQGTSYGQFDVPPDFKGRLLQVNAYTKWMLNFDTALLYQKNLPVISNNVPATSALVIPSLRFFPEGGDIISGMRTKVAFKASDQWGRPLAITGVIQQNGVAIDSLNALHDGMGFIYLIAEQGAAYTAKWKDESGGEHATLLPPAKEDGVSLQVSFTRDKRTFTVERSPGVPEQQKTLHLIATMHQAPVLKTTINLKQDLTYSNVLPVSTLTSGLLTLTLFDEGWNALAERVLHVNNGEYILPLQTSVKTLGLSKRGKNEIELTLPEGIEANLSVSVTDGSIESDSTDHIISRFLLSAELRGSIYRPSYYFKNSSDSLARQLDLVMLTNGWRRFKWEDVTKGKFPVITHPKDTAFLALSGKLSGITDIQLQNGRTMMMMVRNATDTVTKSLFVNIEKDGSFNNAQFIFFDSLQVYYQLPKSLAKVNVDFMTSRLEARKYGTGQVAGRVPLIDVSKTYAKQEQLARQMVVLADKEMLQGVTVTAKRKTRMEQLDEKYTKGLFSGGDAKQFDVMNDPTGPAYPDALYYLQGKVAGLQIKRIIDPIRDKDYELTWRGGEPIIYINEIPADAIELTSLAGVNIAYIKVFTPPFMGPRGGGGDPANGAIAIYTRRGEDGFANFEGPKLPSSIVYGYSPIREFSSPDYATAAAGNVKTDIRTTLLWKPHLTTSKDAGKILLSFYNSDLFSQSLKLTVQGMSKDGRIIYYQEVIK